MTTSTIYLEIQVEVEHDLNVVHGVRIINRTDFPSPTSIEILDFLKSNEIEQAGLAALTELEAAFDKRMALKEDRNRE
jgi:hypothetical protein